MASRNSLKKLAFIVPGGVGDRDSTKTNPTLEEFIVRISKEFDVTVYSLVSVTRENNSPIAEKIKLKSINASNTESLVKRIFLLVRLFLRDHLIERYEIIHGIWAFPGGVLAVVLGKMFRLPVIVSLQGGEAANVPQIAYGNMYNRFLKMITLWTCRHADELTALTQYQWNEIKRFGLYRKNVHIIPYGADTASFTSIKKTFAPPFRFLHVANLNRVKDQQTLLRAFAIIGQHVDCRLRIVGPDYLNGQLQLFIKDLGITNNVEFLGHIPHQHLPAYYAWAHMMLHTSYYEAQAVVVAEAAASGVVVCGTKVGLIADLTNDGAVSVETGNYEDLAKEVLNLLSNRERFEAIRSNAINWASTYDADWTASQFVRLYRQVSEN